MKYSEIIPFYQKLNYRCKKEEQDGEGPGSCSGEKQETSNNNTNDILKLTKLKEKIARKLEGSDNIDENAIKADKSYPKSANRDLFQNDRISKYPHEDWAESITGYILHRESFVREFPNRSKIISRYIK